MRVQAMFGRVSVVEGCNADLRYRSLEVLSFESDESVAFEVDKPLRFGPQKQLSSTQASDLRIKSNSAWIDGRQDGW